MASLRHGFEEPGDVQDIRLVVDTIPTLAWSAGPEGSAEFRSVRFFASKYSAPVPVPANGSLLAEPEIQAHRVAAFVGDILDVGAMANSIDKSLYRNRC